MKKVLTADNTFNEGLNVVVGRGTEFSGEDEIYIQGLGPRKVETEVVNFNNISKDDVENYHSPHGKVYSALLGVLRRQHSSNFDESEQVTVIRFQRNASEAAPVTFETEETEEDEEKEVVKTVAETVVEEDKAPVGEETGKKLDEKLDAKEEVKDVSLPKW